MRLKCSVFFGEHPPLLASYHFVPNRPEKRHLFRGMEAKKQAESKSRKKEEATQSKQSDNVPFLFLLVCKVAHELLALLGDSLLSALAGSLGLGTLGVHLLLEDTLTGLLGLGLVDLFRMSASAVFW
jgi:hypothetical protein